MNDTPDSTNERWTIAHVTARDFKCLEFVDVTPEPGRPLVLIHGPNRTGKSALIDALCAALRGKRHRPTAPIRDGQESSRITAQLSAGETVLDVTCRITEKSQTVEIKQRLGDATAKLAKPQSILDGITTSLMFNPLAFANAKAAEQVAMLYEAIGRADDLRAAHETRREAVAHVREASKDIARLEPLTRKPAAPPGDAAAAAARIRESAEIAPRRSDVKHRIDNTRDRINLARISIEDNDAKVVAMKANIERLQADIASATAANSAHRVAIETSTADLQRMTAELGALPKELTSSELEAAMATRDAHARHGAAVEQATANLKSLEAKRAELATAERAKDGAQAKLDELIGSTSALPPGVGITDDNEVTYNGRPLSNLCGSEKVLLSAAIAAAMNSRLADMFLDEIGVLDDDTLAQLVDFATKHGLRLWATDTDPRDRIDAQRVPMPDSNTPATPDTEQGIVKAVVSGRSMPPPKTRTAPTPTLPDQGLLEL